MRFRPHMGRWAIAAIVLVGIAAILSGNHADIPLADLQSKYANEASRHINIQGTSVHYRDEGQGPPLLLLHGTGASLHTWDRWTEILQPYFRIVRLDLPGFGLTGPDANRDYTISHYVDVVQAFTQALELPRFHLAGNSLGGEIAWNYALEHPQQVDRLILIDAAGHPESSRKDVPLVFRLARLPLINRLLTRITPRSIHRRSIVDVYGDPNKINDALIDRYFELSLRPGNRQAFVDRVRVITSSPETDPGMITQPTLVMWGAKDRWIPLADGEAFARDIPGAELRVYPNAGHVPMEEIPDKTAAAAHEFLVN
jgi:pimeloyl-ACP methyl ester carboxylesterase